MSNDDQARIMVRMAAQSMEFPEKRSKRIPLEWIIYYGLNFFAGILVGLIL